MLVLNFNYIYASLSIFSTLAVYSIMCGLVPFYLCLCSWCIYSCTILQVFFAPRDPKKMLLYYFEPLTKPKLAISCNSVNRPLSVCTSYVVISFKSPLKTIAFLWTHFGRSHFMIVTSSRFSEFFMMS